MTTREQILEIVDRLPNEKQAEALLLLQKLEPSQKPMVPRFVGKLRGDFPEMTLKDIQDLRRECWSSLVDDGGPR